MEKEANERIKELAKEIESGQIKEKARKAGNLSSWTRERKMPLYDILICILGKKGLSTVIEISQYFQGAGKEEQAVSKQDYQKQRQQLNPEVFKILNGNYLRRFYGGEEAKTWEGYLVMAVDGSRRTKVRRKYRTARRTASAMGKDRISTGIRQRG